MYVLNSHSTAQLQYHQLQLRHIPTEGGPSLPILSFIGLYNFLTHGREIIQRGYQQVCL